jgi:hypothetical protein
VPSTLPSDPPLNVRRYFRYVAERDTLVRSLKTALVVGTVLGLLNHYPALLARSLPPAEAVQIVLTYLVPFSVATYGQVMGKAQRDRERAAASRAGHRARRQTFLGEGASCALLDRRRRHAPAGGRKPERP